MLTTRFADFSNQFERVTVIKITIDDHHWEDKGVERIARLPTIANYERDKPF